MDLPPPEVVPGTAPPPEPVAPAVKARWPAFPERLRIPAQTLILIIGFGIFVPVAHYHYPIQEWLFWHYAGYWLACAIWAAACTSFGHFIVKRVLSHALPFREHISTSFATGVFAFYVFISVAGLFHAYGAVL